jgi:acylphosphatase
MARLGSKIQARYISGGMQTVRMRIAGRVQGVGYRVWATRIATGLGLRGWVRNRSDGTVEMLVTGPDNAVAAMIEAAHQGPPAARVREVHVCDDRDDGSVNFVAQPTQ